MTPPKCPFCGVLEWRHICATNTKVLATNRLANAITEKPVSQKEVMDNGVANTYRYRDAEKRKDYMKVLMQLKRALASGRACSWPKVV